MNMSANLEESRHILVGQSPRTRQVLRLIERLGKCRWPALLLGETGTGKELIARAVHDHSRRKSRTFVKMNCAAIPTGLLIGDAWLPSSSGKRIDIIDPSTEQVLTSVADATDCTLVDASSEAAATMVASPCPCSAVEVSVEAEASSSVDAGDVRQSIAC